MKYLQHNKQRGQLKPHQRLMANLIKNKYDVSSNRELYLMYFVEQLGLKDKKIHVCDVGGSDGWALSYKNKNITKYVLDKDNLYKKELEKNGINFIHGEIGIGKNKIKNKFDIVLLNHVIEHISDYNLAVQELKDMLKKGGHIIVRCPNILHRQNKTGFWNDFTHVKPYTPNSLNSLFESNGFKTKTIRTFSYNKFMIGFMFNKKIQNKMYSINGDEILYVGEK